MVGIRAAMVGAAIALAGAACESATAADYTVHLVSENERGKFHFEPQLLYAQVGDVVRFVPDDAMHAVKSVPGMLPAGAAPWRGYMGETLEVQLDRPGVYGVKCRAGYDVGMVGLIVVGDQPANWDEARAVRHPPRASEAFAELFDEAGCRLHLTACPN